MAAPLSTKPRLAIAGTGAMACLFGARLAPYADVTLLGTWSEGLTALQARGILYQVDGETTAVPVRATSDPTACAGTSMALVLVKSWQTERAARQLALCLAENGVALTLQNGLGNLEALAHALGAERAAVGVTTQGANLVGPGHVRAGGAGVTHLAVHSRLSHLAALLTRAGFRVETAEEVEALQWSKLAVNAGINPLTAILNVPNGELLRRPSALHLLQAAVEEVAAVAAAKGLGLAAAELIQSTESVARRTGENISSMLQDVRRGAPTEIDAISGAVAREGERLGVPAPVNAALRDLVTALVPARMEAPA